MISSCTRCAMQRCCPFSTELWANSSMLVGNVNPESAKCSLIQFRIWDIIKDGKIAADRSKLDQIREWPFPKTGNEMASFLGLFNYYRRLIPHFAEYAEPMYK